MGFPSPATILDAPRIETASRNVVAPSIQPQRVKATGRGFNRRPLSEQRRSFGRKMKDNQEGHEKDEIGGAEG